MLIIINVLPIFSLSLNAQSTGNCEVLNYILKNKEIQRAFLTNKKAGEDIIIADMAQLNLDQCKVDLASGQRVCFQKDTLPAKKKGMLHIVLYELKNHGQNWTAQLHQMETNAYAKIKVRKRRRSMNVVSLEIGHF